MAIDLDGPNSAINVNTIETHSGSTLTIGKSGDTVSLGSGASASGFTKDGAITWDSSIKSANTSITTGTGFFVDTTSAAITITLPGSPSVGDIVCIKDYAGTFGTNNLTIARNGSNIQGAANDSSISTDRASVVLVYADATRGWLYTVESNVGELENKQYVAATGGTITTSGDYKIHTFTSSGTFTVTDAGNAAGSDSVDYMVVAGGGAGGSHGPDSATNGGGGGAGGFRESVPSPAAWTASPIANPGGALPVSVQGYPVTIGAGATSTYPGTNNPANKGSDSIFSTITSAGGGGGSAHPANAVKDGGSGAGGAGTPSSEYPGGSGNTPAVSPPQGNPGGKSNLTNKAGGGGGAASAGTAGATPAPYSPGQAAGGQGATTEINASSNTYAGGGGGSNTNASNGGPGGGGSGGLPVSGSTGSNATANTGGGGGGGPHSNPGTPNNGGNGGSGIVVIRYKFQN